MCPSYEIWDWPLPSIFLSLLHFVYFILKNQLIPFKTFWTVSPCSRFLFTCVHCMPRLFTYVLIYFWVVRISFINTALCLCCFVCLLVCFGGRWKIHLSLPYPFQLHFAWTLSTSSLSSNLCFECFALLVTIRCRHLIIVANNAVAILRRIWF